MASIYESFFNKESMNERAIHLKKRSTVSLNLFKPRLIIAQCSYCNHHRQHFTPFVFPLFLKAS